MTAPHYQEVKAADIPQAQDEDGTLVRVVCGSYGATKGPVEGIAADPVYLDVSVPAGLRKTLPVEATHQAFAYVFAGAGEVLQRLRPAGRCRPKASDGRIQTLPTQAENCSLVLFDRGDEIAVQAGEDGHPIPADFGEARSGNRLALVPAPSS